MIVAMTLPPSAGRVCLRMPTRFVAPLLKSPISSLVQSAVRPGPTGVGDPRGELAAERGGAEEHHLGLTLADEVGRCAVLWAIGANEPRSGCSMT